MTNFCFQKKKVKRKHKQRQRKLIEEKRTSESRVQLFSVNVNETESKCRNEFSPSPTF